MIYLQSELLEAKESLLSLIHKSEKALLKLHVGSGTYTYLKRRIQAFHLSITLIEEKLLKESND